MATARALQRISLPPPNASTVTWTIADALIAAADLAQIVLDDAAAIIASWQDADSDLRSDGAARSLLDALPIHPVVSARLVATLCDVTEQAARTAIGQLARRGVLTEFDITEPGLGRPRRWFAATQLLELLD